MGRTTHLIVCSILVWELQRGGHAQLRLEAKGMATNISVGTNGVSSGSAATPIKASTSATPAAAPNSSSTPTSGAGATSANSTSANSNATPLTPSNARPSTTSTTSYSSFYSQLAPFDQRMAMLIAAVLDAVLGKKDEDDSKNTLAGLAGLMLLSGLTQSQSSYFESTTSQVSSTSTAQSNSAVQASSYTQGTPAQAASQSGGNINVTA